MDFAAFRWGPPAAQETDTPPSSFFDDDAPIPAPIPLCAAPAAPITEAPRPRKVVISSGSEDDSDVISKKGRKRKPRRDSDFVVDEDSSSESETVPSEVSDGESDASYGRKVGFYLLPDLLICRKQRRRRPEASQWC